MSDRNCRRHCSHFLEKLLRSKTATYMVCYDDVKIQAWSWTLTNRLWSRRKSDLLVLSVAIPRWDPARSKQNLITEKNVSSSKPQGTADLLMSGKLHTIGSLHPIFKHANSPTSRAPKGKPPIWLEPSTPRSLQQSQGLHQQWSYSNLF